MRIFSWLAFVVLSAGLAHGQPVEVVRPTCEANCFERDAIVFVHGIYGGAETFRNSSTKFDWPSNIPESIFGRLVDVYKLNYDSELANWANKQITFPQLSRSVFERLKPLRQKRYRSINFIAHSLGGNVAAAYLLQVKNRLGTANLAQHGFVIMLATPTDGAAVADVVGRLKRILGMQRDPLLETLEVRNQLLEFLWNLREANIERLALRRCRPVNLHAAFEQKRIAGVTIVTKESAGKHISKLLNSGIVGFQLDHVSIAKPARPDDLVYEWVRQRVDEEFARMELWHRNDRDAVPTLCERDNPIPE